jgi:hypothetical protein
VCIDHFFDPNSEKTAQQIESFCKQYCFNQVNESKNGNKNVLAHENDDLIDLVDSGGGGGGGAGTKAVEKLDGALYYYKNFISALVRHLTEQVSF